MGTATARGIDRVRDWVLAKHPERDSIAPDEDLISGRLVDSLAFVEFVFTIEEASGAEIDTENIDLEDFRTLNAIEKKHFG